MRLLRAFGMWLTLAVSACATPAVTPARAAAPAPTQVAPGVYMVEGDGGEVDAGNLGRIGNAGFIIGPNGVLAIDTGTSYRHGVALLAAIRQVSTLPIRAVLITHTRQEFLFGAAAFREQGVPVHMQRQAAGLMAARCERCLKTLNQVLGRDAMAGTTLFKPDREFDTSDPIDGIGRPVEVRYFGHSSGPGDIAVVDVRTGTVFAGGLVDQLRIPDVQDADLPGWHRALQALREHRIERIVPGHGPLAPPAAIDAVESYLTRLEGRVTQLLQDGAALSDVPDAAALPEFAGWDQYETVHRRNASVLFVRLERDQMLKQAHPKD